MILAEVPAAPAAAGLGDIAVGLAIVLTFCFLYGAKKGYDYSFGALLEKCANLFRAKIPLTNIGIPGGGALASAFDKVNDFVQRQLASGLLASETVLAKWWHAQEALVRYTYDSLAYFAGETHRAIDSLVHGTIPQAVGAGTHAVKVDVGKLRGLLQAQAATLEHDLRKTARTLEAEIERDFGKAWRGIDHIRGSLRGELAHVLTTVETDLRALDRYARRALNRRLTLLEELVGAGVIGAAGLWIVSRTFPWLRCSNVRNVGRAICRFPTGLLTALLADALEAAVLVNICEAVKVFTKTADAFEPELRGLVTVTGAALRCSGGDAPAPLDARGASLPARQTAAELPGV